MKNPTQFLDDLVRGLQSAGNEIHEKSQRYVPVDNGTLRSSSPGAEHLHNGFRIVYGTKYAARQEFGLEPGYTEHVDKHGVRSFKIKRHTRTTKKGKTIVVPERIQAAHSRGPFDRTFKQGYKGRFYLTKAFDEVRPRLVEFLKRLQRNS